MLGEQGQDEVGQFVNDLVGAGAQGGAAADRLEEDDPGRAGVGGQAADEQGDAGVDLFLDAHAGAGHGRDQPLLERFDLSVVDSGFGNGTIYYPTDTRQGTFGAVTVIPGFLGWEGTLQWLGPRLASQGFVVMTLNPLTPLDPPFTRGDELVAALKYLTSAGSVKDRIDPHRLGVIGWSMGGGGALRAAAADPDIKADVALSPWDIGGVAGQVSTPTLIFGGG
ncbi:MAG TPA: hypothetical protein VFV01_12650 [Spirillospora sp.]|nr:hypothetical protein [Spirillospora sp.]